MKVATRLKLGINYMPAMPRCKGSLNALIRTIAVVSILAASLALSVAQDYLPQIDSALCPESLTEQAALHDAITCGWLQVPEDRAKLDGDWIKVFFARLASRQQTDSAPLLVLAGGPGDAASSDIDYWLSTDLHQERDIILVDQRGVGMSQPSLDCPEFGGDLWLLTCRERLTSRGINLSAYNSLSIVRDILDLLVTLELEQVNLYGNSYGSRIALLLADFAPERIRSMVLDGVYPPPKSDIVDLAHNTVRALERLFDDCEAAPACHNMNPDLRLRFYDVISDMNESPRELYNMGENAGVFMNGDEFLLWSADMLAYPGAVPILPALIASFHAGSYDFLLSINEFVKAPYWDAEDTHGEGVYLSVRCSDDLKLDTYSRWLANSEVVKEEISNALNPIIRKHLADCELWNVRPSPAPLDRAVESDVPSLLLSGAYDRTTPPHYGDFAAEHLGVSWHYVFPSAGHGVLETEECANLLILAFLSNPNHPPAHDCLNAVHPPDFAMEQRG